MISYTCCTIGLEEIEWNKSLNFHNGLVDSITICVQQNPAKLKTGPGVVFQLANIICNHWQYFTYHYDIYILLCCLKMETFRTRG